MLSIFGNRKCVVSRELTKYYETFYRGDLKKISMESLKINLKGEITVIIDKPDEESSSEKIILENEKLKKIFSFSKNKISTKNLSTLLSIIYKKPKKLFYSHAIKYFK